MALTISWENMFQLLVSITEVMLYSRVLRVFESKIMEGKSTREEIVKLGMLVQGWVKLGKEDEQASGKIWTKRIEWFRHPLIMAHWDQNFLKNTISIQPENKIVSGFKYIFFTMDALMVQNSVFWTPINPWKLIFWSYNALSVSDLKQFGRLFTLQGAF